MAEREQGVVDVNAAAMRLQAKMEATRAVANALVAKHLRRELQDLR